VGTVETTCTGGRYAWSDIRTQLADARGVRDLYVVFDTPGVNLRALRFEDR
jgi:hypothetical protein